VLNQAPDDDLPIVKASKLVNTHSKLRILLDLEVSLTGGCGLIVVGPIKPILGTKRLIKLK
jgi:hypothetical protein